MLWWNTSKSWLPSPSHTSFMWQQILTLEAPRSLMCGDWNNLSVWWPKMARAITHPLGFSELWGAWKPVHTEPSAVKAFSLLNTWMNQGEKIRSVFFPIIMAFSIQFLGMLLTASGHNTKISGMLVQGHLSCVPAPVGLEMLSLQRAQNRG